MSIKVDYATLENANQQIQSTSRGIEERLEGLRTRLSRIEWQGEDQAAYEQHRQEWESAMRGINQVLNEIGKAVGVAREQYMQTERANAQSWGG